MNSRASKTYVTAVACGLVCTAQLLAAQGASTPRLRSSGPLAAPPPPPAPPATVSRSAEGGVTVRAVRTLEAMRVDGRLDESVYTTVPAISDLVQQEPREGEPATEKTDLWILFDNKNLYISARCWDSHPEREVANEMRRDSLNILQNEHVAIALDTFHDKRTSLVLIANSLGGLRDGVGTDETSFNGDWNAIWDAKTGKFDNGWTIEIVIPFKSMRYKPGPDQVWGFIFRRHVRWKNESSFLSSVPAFLGFPAIMAVSLAPTMVGLEVPNSGRNFEVKPYAISGLRADRSVTPSLVNKGESNVGVDAKYGVTKGLTLDLTYNTDFAQVEDDLQQVNLTRFNLFFPERREFFLEGQGIFGFGPGSPGAATTSNTPVMFFSRQIGLNNGRPVPIVGGGRLTGKAGAFSLGMLNIQSGEDAAAGARPTNFSVLRIKRDILRSSNIGALYTRRAQTDGGREAGETFGVDALYSASRSLNVNAYFARTRRPDEHRDDTSHLVRFDYNTDRAGLQLERLAVGDGFNPEVGFVRRSDFQREFALVRFSPRPAREHMKAVRRFSYQGSLEYIENGTGRLETREAAGSFDIELQSSDRLSIRYERDYELIPRPFSIAANVTVPVGGYDYQNNQLSYHFGTQRALSGTLTYEQGSLYGGTKKTLGFSGGRLEVTSQVAVEPIVSANRVELPWGAFTSTVMSVRPTYTMTPRMFVSALVQFNSSVHTLSTNARLRWEYRPGSELFVVYSDGRDTFQKGFPELMNRAFVIKANRMLRF